MAAPKREEDMTATELFMLNSGRPDYESAARDPSLYDRFKDEGSQLRETARNAIAEGAGIIKGTDEKYRSFVESFQKDHPLVGALPGAAKAAMGMLAPPVGIFEGFRALASGHGHGAPQEPVDPARDPEAAVPTSLAGGGAPGLHAPGIAASAAPMQQVSMGGRSAPDPLGGVGSDKSLLGAQNQQLADADDIKAKKRLEGEAHTGVMEQEASGYDRIAQAKAAEANAVKEAADLTDKEQQDHEEKIQSAMDDQAKMGVDPGRTFKDRDIGFWLSMSIGAAAGGMLQAMNNMGSNPFMDTLREVVRNDINAQEKDIELGQGKIKNLETAYERMRARGADRVTATMRQYDKVLESVQSDIQSKLAQAKIPEHKAALETMLSSVQAERDAQATKIQEYWAHIKQQRASAAAAAANAAFHRNLAFKKLQLEERELDIKQQHVNQESLKGRAGAGAKMNENFVPTGTSEDGSVVKGFLAPDETTARKLTKRIESNAQIVSLAQEAMEHRKRLERKRAMGLYNPVNIMLENAVDPDAQALQRISTRLVGFEKEGAELGALDNGVLKLLAPVVGDLDSLGPSGGRKIEALIAEAKRSTATVVSSSGSAQAVRGVDPTTGMPFVIPTGGLNKPSNNEPVGDVKGATRLK